MTPAEPLISFAAFAAQLDARSIGGSASADRGPKAVASDVPAEVEPAVDRMRERALEMGIEMGSAAQPRAARGSSPNLRR